MVSLVPRLEALAAALRARGWRMASAESCTGGLIAAACTSLAGSSDWFERGFVTYSNEAKVELLGVPTALLQAHGAVSEPVARAMALGALARAPVQASVAVTGIAGPGGAVPGKPVGTVWLAVATARVGAPVVRAECLHLDGDRQQVRWQTLEIALQRLLAGIEEQPAPGNSPSQARGMKVLLSGRLDAVEHASWLAALRAAMPEAQWFDEGQARAQPGAVEAAVVADPAPGSLMHWPGLKLIQSLWAGVDRLLDDPSLPAHVPLARMVDPSMNRAMAETALWATLSLHRGAFGYARQQRRAEWTQLPQRRADEVRVLVLGQGEMGRAAAAALAQQGYRVSGWSRAPHEGQGVDGIRRMHGGAALPAALAACDVLINLLPLTAQTRGLLDAKLFAALPAGASVVNLGRGAHLNEVDLLAALDTGHLQHAVLDVFAVEPLPAAHPFWSHERVTVLPHAAAQTDPRTAAEVVAKNLRAVRDGRPPVHLVDRQRGY